MRALVAMSYPNKGNNVRDLYRAQSVEDGACTPSISRSCKCGDNNGQCAFVPCPLRQSHSFVPGFFLLFFFFCFFFAETFSL